MKHYYKCPKCGMGVTMLYSATVLCICKNWGGRPVMQEITKEEMNASKESSG